MKTHLDGCERFRIQSAQSIQSQTKSFSYFLSPGLSKTLSLGLPHVAHNYFLSIKGKLLWALGRSSHPHFLSWEGHSLLWLSDQVPQRPLLAENKGRSPSREEGSWGRSCMRLSHSYHPWAHIPTQSIPRDHQESSKWVSRRPIASSVLRPPGSPSWQAVPAFPPAACKSITCHSGFYQILISSCQEVSLPLCQVHVSFCRGKMTQVLLFHTRAGVSGSAFSFSWAQSPDRRSWRCRAMCNNPG